MDLDAKIEAYLFWKAEPASLKTLTRIFKRPEEEITLALTALEKKLINRGIILMRKDNEVTLRTAPEVSKLIESLRKEELKSELGKASLETLAIILYKGPITRQEIDYIRGVNGTFTLRALLVRGLVERVTDNRDQRRFLYKPTFDLLSHLGLKKITDLPEFETVCSELESFRVGEDTLDAENGRSRQDRNRTSNHD